ncbi:MAG: peroxidase family protein [Terricaulis sp.]
MAVAFDRTDLEYILKQILMAETGTTPSNPHLAFGLREVAGTDNNQVPGQGAYGSADQAFPTATTQYFQMVTVNIDGTAFDPHPGVDGDTITTNYASSDPNGFVVDSGPRIISNLIADISSNNPAAVEAAQQFGDQLGYGYTVNPTNPTGLVLSLGADGVAGTADDYWGADGVEGTSDDVDAANLFIGNITPDAGLSAPFNSWMTFFGQFFDHGLDMINKGGAGTVYIPLMPDDPLYVPGSPTNFMILTRASVTSVSPGPDGVLGTSDDIHTNTNQTTPFVDQNQTYSSNPSHQFFLREYAVGIDGELHSTGRLLTHAAGSDGIVGTADDNTGMATWADVKANALQFGLQLTDYDVVNVPLLATDAYGNYQPGAHGHAQVVVDMGGGNFTLYELDPTSPVTLAQIDAITGGTVALTGHAFINDTAFNAVPFANDGVTTLLPDTDDVAGNAIGMNQMGDKLFYDDELLNAHYIAGDGRVNENFALTTVHEVFHDEHNRLLEQTKQLIRDELAKGDTAFALNWVLDGADLSDGIQENEWNGERLFQVAKFGTETQYQHLVFEEFARKIAPTIHLFGNVDIHLDPAIVSEFANAVYRFGHSMLDENLPVYELNDDGTPMVDGSGNPVLTDYGLIQAFTNPLAFAELGADGAAQVVQGTTHQIGSEIDEFVTGALRNNLLGMPLDLAALNIARARDTGVAPLNLVRAQIYAATQDSQLKAYTSWDDFGANLKHPASLINFIAAYGTHASILAATTLEAKRDAAATLVLLGEDPASKTGDAQAQDAYNFMHSLGVYANDLNNPLAVHAEWSTGNITGLDNVDLWIGGLAEKQNLNGGLLGSTFDFIFETQMESLQDGDRLYYLPRIEGIHWGSEIEGNSFAEMIMTNTGAKHLPGSIFSTPEYTIEARDYFLKDANSADGFAHDADGHRIATDPSSWLHNPVTGALLVEVKEDGTVHFIGDDNFLGNTIVLGGTDGDDRLQAGVADTDTVWGDGGNDWIDGGDGDDFLYGGDGNDIIEGGAGLDTIHGEAGNDTIHAGTGDDVLFGGDGDDYIDGGAGIDDILGGLGNDIIKGGEDDDEISGNEGDDWIEGGSGGDLLVGDQGAPTGDVPWISGNDVLIGGAQGDRMQGFSGDDIMLGEGGFDKFEGRLGFDWASFEREIQGVSVDMERREFVDQPQAIGGDAIRDFFIETEAVSGSAFNDFLMGTNDSKVDPFNALTNPDLIFGLKDLLPPNTTSFSGGNIMLGGDGSDIIMGRGGNDIIDGDAYLHVALSGDGGAGSEIIREIFYDITPGDIDTAVFTDVFSNYTITGPDDQGFYTIAHTNPGATGGGGAAGGVAADDGIDRVRNIERLQFADQTISLDTGPDANHIPTGAIRIVGDTNIATPAIDPTVGSPLSSVNTLADVDGIVAGSMKYQWEIQDPVTNDFVAIAGATDTSYRPVATQVGQDIRLHITYVDGKGFTEHVFSTPTAAVLPSPAVNTAPFVVPQQGLVGLPDTSARVGIPLSLFVPTVTAFGDNETASNLLTYKVTLVSNGHVLDGSAAVGGLLYSDVFDTATGLLSGGRITGTINAAGPVTIRVTASDPSGLSVTDDFIINVQNGNRAPVANAAVEAFAGSEDHAVSGVLLSGSDPDGNPTIFRLVPNSATHGTVTSFNLSTGAFTFVGDANFAGQATFSYQLFDGQLTSTAKTVTINLAPVDDGASTLLITGTAAEGQTLTAWLTPDPDGPVTDIQYQWFRDGVAFGALTSNPDITLTVGDVGHVFSASATYVDGQGFNEGVASAAIDPVGTLSLLNVSDAKNAMFAVFNSLTDPDGNPTPDGQFLFWETSADGITWSPADPFLLNFDGSQITLARKTTQFIRATVAYVDGGGNFGTATTDALHVLVGGGFADNLTGGDGRDFIFGFGGRDTINGGGGDDYIVGGVGDDTINGGSGDDVVVYAVGDGADTINGGAGDDTLRVSGTAAADVLLVRLGNEQVEFNNVKVSGVEHINVDLGGGGDTLDYTGSNTALTVDLGAGVASGFSSVANVLNVTGASGADILTGDALNNRFMGQDGNDVLTGGAGNDVLLGNKGSDRFVATAGDGDDNYDGGAGPNDTLDLSNISTSVTVNLITGTATGADIGHDTIARIEDVIGGSGDDTIVANSAKNTFTGGAGNDLFRFTSVENSGKNGIRDTITDFVSGHDKIDFSAIDADARSSVAGTQHFVFDGERAAGSETVGHIGYHYEVVGGLEYTVIEGNVRVGNNLDNNVDFQVALQGHLTLNANDLILGGG